MFFTCIQGNPECDCRPVGQCDAVADNRFARGIGLLKMNVLWLNIYLMIKSSFYRILTVFQFVVAVSTFLGSSAFAAEIDHAAAERIASAYVELEPALSRGGPSGPESQPYYIFNDRTPGKGFVIISGRDDIGPVIGYSDRGLLDESHMPDALRTLLSGIGSMKAGGQQAARAEGPSQAVVEPLISTRWYQLAPYNSKLPAENLFTCCVATALAQVMYYHRWPEQGHGYVSYDSYAGLDGRVDTESLGHLELDLSKSVYAWDDMLLRYENNNWTREQADAVATLMRDCGHAIHAQYTTVESSAFDQDLLVALVEHFGYDAQIYLNYGDLDPQQWQAIIKSDLDNGFPGIMSGHSTMYGHAGHCFVVDGYDTDGFFHINWGWAGDADGYFNSSLLTPFHGGKQLNYSFLQCYTSVRPRKPYSDKVANKPLTILWDLKNTSIDTSGLLLDNADGFARNGESARIRVVDLAYLGSRSYEGSFGLDIVDGSGKFVRNLLTVPVSRRANDAGYQDQVIRIEPMEIAPSAFSGLPDGDYRIIPVSTMTGMEKLRVQTYGYKKYVSLNVSGGKPVLAEVAAPENRMRMVKGLALEAEMPLFAGSEQVVVIANEGEFLQGGEIRVTAVPSDGEGPEVLLCSQNAAVYPDQALEIPLHLRFMPFDGPFSIPALREGTAYAVSVTMVSGDDKPIPLENNTELTTTFVYDEDYLPKMVIDSVELLDEDENPVDTDNAVIDIEGEYTMNYTYRSVGKGLSPVAISYVESVLGGWPVVSSRNLASKGVLCVELQPMYMDIDEGEHVLSLNYADFMTGETVPAEPLSLSRLKIRLADMSGVEDITVSGKAVEVARHNAMGVRLSAPAPGLNIITYSDGSTRKVYVR